MLHLNTVFGSFGWIFESKLFSFPSFGFLSKRKSPPNSIRQQVVWSAQSKHFSFNSRNHSVLQRENYLKLLFSMTDCNLSESFAMLLYPLIAMLNVLTTSQDPFA